MALTLFTVLFIPLLYGDSVLGVTVHFSSPGEKHVWAGVYRAVVDIDTLLESPQSEASAMGADFTCARLGNTFRNGLAVRSLSYDADAGRTLVQIQQIRNRRSTAISDKTCSPEKSCGKYSPQYRVVMKSQRTMDRGFIQPLASSSDSLYFVYTPNGDYAESFGYMSSLQLRKVNAGYTFPTSDYPSPIDVNSFSTLIADIRDNGRWLQAGYTLLTVPGESDGDLVFLTVARSIVYPRPRGDDPQFSYVLMAVHGNVAKVLHMTADTTKKWYGHELRSEGGVSFKDGMVCWTVADSILCGTWSPDQPLNPPADVEAVLVRGQAATVCKYPEGDYRDYRNITTGVAVLETPAKDGRLALLFGCIASTNSNGGLGLLVRDPSKDEVDIIPVRYDNKPILAGAMFVTPDDMCKAENKMRRLFQGLNSWYVR